MEPPSPASTPGMEPPSPASTPGTAAPSLEAADPASPPFPVPPEALAVLERLWQAGHAAYLVGGGVRDALLGLAVADWDVATDAHPERILRMFPGSSYENRFGTVLARGLEITTFRRDHRYADHRRPDSVTFSGDVYEDLARRDLTINAIAWGRRGPDEPARLLDPADGQGDLRARLVRAVGDPGRRFDEDALRLLRAVRIAARLDFTIDPVTRAAMEAHAGDLEWVSEERMGAELRDMLVSAAPARAIRLLRETGLLAGVLPELDRLPTAVLDEALATLDRVAAARPGDERLSFAGLLQPLEASDVRAALERLRLPGRDVEAVAAMVETATTAYEDTWGDADVRRYLAGIPSELVDDVLLLRAARAAEPGAPGPEARLAARIRAQQATAAPLSLADLAVDGHDLRETLALPEGPIVGRLLGRLLDDVLEEPALNRRTTLLTRASLHLDELASGRRSEDHDGEGHRDGGGRFAPSQRME